jgi:hypothetical protein
MKRLLNPRNNRDLKLLGECLDSILLSPPSYYTTEGLGYAFKWILDKFSNPDQYPHFYVAAEIVKTKITRLHIGYSLNISWNKPNFTLPIYMVGFIYNAPGSVADPRDHSLGQLVTDKFASIGMYTWYSLLPMPRKIKNIDGYSERVAGSSGFERLTGFIDQVIDSQEKLDKLREDFFGLGSFGILPTKYVSPLMLVMHNLRPKYRNIKAR